MTAKINISNLGNSLALPIPDYIVKFFNLKAEDLVREVLKRIEPILFENMTS
jgi:antitoxin component of MazEF toxin-antitoxin module